MKLKNNRKMVSFIVHHSMYIIYNLGNGQMKRKTKSNANEKINNLTGDWFVSARSKNILISGPIIQSYNCQIAEELRNTEYVGC